jgi:DHA1 family tetracycline resistance protein-like MFS transporter
MQDSGPEQLTTPETIPADAELPAASSSSKRALLIVFLVMFIDLLGFGIVLPLLPRYGKELLEPLLPGDAQAKLRGAILGLLMASFSAMQFLFAPIWGRLSDRVGRRPFLLLGLAGSVIFYALFGFASDWGRAPGRELLGLTLLFIARIGAGIAGATVSTAQAVIADTTTPERRSQGMALIGVAFGLGFTLGPAFAAIILAILPQVHGGPGYLASVFSCIAFTLAVAIMPETLRPGAPHKRQTWFHLAGLRLALQTPTVATLILIFFLSVMAFASFEPTLAFLTGDVLGYGDAGNSVVFSYVGLVLMLAQGVLYRRLARRGVAEITFMSTGSVLMALGLGGLGAATVCVAEFGSQSRGPLLTGFLAALAVAVTGFSFVTPSVQSLISRRSDPHKQGEILGVNQSANAMSRIVGPALGTPLYFIHPSHVLPYAFGVVLLLVVLLLIPRVREG